MKPERFRLFAYLATLILSSVISMPTFASGAGNAAKSAANNVTNQAKQFFNSMTAKESDVDKFQRSWGHKAISLQNHLDYNSPLATATFLMTHNSFNSSSYTTAVRYPDPNQYRSIYDQLRMGIRSLELDTHYYFKMQGWPWQWKKQLLLCHGENNHLGCGSFDRKLTEGLDEINRFLREPANKKEVVVIYIEDHMDGQYAKAVQAFSKISDLVYRPAGNSCQGIPMNITKQDIINAGKQVLIMGGGAVCSSSAGWDTWAYAGVGDRKSGYPTGTVAKLNGTNCDFSRSFYDKYWVRFYEDRTAISAAFGSPGAAMTASKVVNAEKCGANLIGMDKLTPYDGRLKAAIWSWDTNEPNNWNNSEDCAVQKGNGRFNDANCSNRYQYACRQPNTHNWIVTSGAGQQSNGASQCQAETGGRYRFSTPMNRYDNEQLKIAKSVKGVSDVWLNYNDRATEGNWVAH